MKIPVLISAHRKGRQLECILTGYVMQKRPADQLILAPDGMDPAIVVAMNAAQAQGWRLSLLHPTRPQSGVGHYRALDCAILAADGELLLITDGDGIARDDYLAKDLRRMRRAICLAGGGHISIPERYRLRHDLRPEMRDPSLFQYRRLSALPRFRKSSTPLARALDLLRPRNANSCASRCALRGDVLAVGGFAAMMGYGGGLNLGLRLHHVGVRGVRAQHALASLHWDHGRSDYCADGERAHHGWHRAVRQARLVLARASQIRSLAGAAP